MANGLDHGIGAIFEVEKPLTPGRVRGGGFPVVSRRLGAVALRGHISHHEDNVFQYNLQAV
jgi:hypothetical protein